jgi:hypothetical protein
MHKIFPILLVNFQNTFLLQIITIKVKNLLLFRLNHRYGQICIKRTHLGAWKKRWSSKTSDLLSVTYSNTDGEVPYLREPGTGMNYFFKWKTYHTDGTVPNSNRKIVARGKQLSFRRHTYMTAHFSDLV